MNLETKIMYLKKLVLFFSFLLFSFWGNAQDCTLGIGSENTDMLVQVFQLNEEQMHKMDVWRAELEIETKVIEDDIQKLLNTHPQSSSQQLTALAGKYKTLQQKIIDIYRAADKKLLSIFNEKQYKRYLELCDAVYRKPIKVVPVPLKEKGIDPE